MIYAILTYSTLPTLIMAPQTRANYRRGTLPGTLECKEADTLKKTRFFHAFNAQIGARKLRPIARAQEIPLTTAHRWLRQQRQLGSSAYRHTRKLSTRLRRPSSVTESDIQALLNAPQDVRIQPLAAQLAIHNIPLSLRQAQRKLKEYSNGGGKYKAAYFKDDLSPQNEADRVKYGTIYRGKSMNDLWWWIIFTDEFHYNPSLNPDPMVLREQGTRYDNENIVARAPKGASLTVRGSEWVNWYDKCDKLIFWLDTKAEKVTKEQTQELKSVMNAKATRRQGLGVYSSCSSCGLPTIRMRLLFVDSQYRY